MRTATLAPGLLWALVMMAPAAAEPAADEVRLGFEQERAAAIEDAAGTRRGTIEGEAGLSDEGRGGSKALQLLGPAKKGCARFAADLAATPEGSFELWLRPAGGAGILVGKYGAINIEIPQGGRAIRFDLKLKEGWHSLEAAGESLRPGTVWNSRPRWRRSAWMSPARAGWSPTAPCAWT